MPEIADYVAALKQHSRKLVVLALRQLLRMVREYPREPLLAAVREAGRYGLYDLDRVERMILRRVARDYFLLNDDPEETMNKGNLKLSDELEQLLKNLHLNRILDIYGEQLQAPPRRKMSPTPSSSPACCGPSGITARKPHWRGESSSQAARNWSLTSFPFARQPGVSRKQIHTLAELDFIAKAENIVLVGETGVGKTGLASGLLLKALENGYRCQFIRAQDLFDEMYASLADRSSRKLLNRLVAA